MTIRIPRPILAFLLVALSVAGGGVGGYFVGRGSSRTRSIAAAPFDQRLKLWQARQGQDWDLYRAQFFAGFAQGCSDVFLSTDVAGNLTDSSGHPWTVDDCNGARPDIETTLPSDGPPKDPAAAGLTNGKNYGCKAIILKSNSDLRGITVPGKPVRISLDYCDHRYPQDFSGAVFPVPG